MTETQYTIGGVDYTDELPGSVSGGDNALVVTNDIPTVDKRAKKSWSQNKLPENTSVTLKITATVSGSEDDIFGTLGLSVDQEQVLDGSESTAWEATWPDLPMYDVDGREITYTVEETAYQIGSVDYGDLIPGADETPAEGYDFSFTNLLPTTEVTVNKTWDGADTWPNEDISVLMTLMSNGGIAEDLPSYIPTDEPGATAVEQTATVELTAAERSRTWHDLPMYDSDGELITYTVVETGVKYGDHELTNVFAVTGEGEPDDEGEVTIDNANETEIEVTKVWKLNDRDRTDKESITFEVYRKVGEAEPVKLDKVYASVGEADPSETEGSEVTVQYEDGAWQTVKISGLPRYELVIDSDAGTAAYVPVSYFVEETGADEKTHVTYEAAQPDDEPATETEPATKTGAETTDTTDNEKADPEEAAVNSGRITICNRDYEVAVNVLKVGQEDENKKLPGAWFQLEVGSRTTKVSEQDPTKTEDVWNYAVSGEEVETDNDGALKFEGLTDGRYRIIETRTPAGYIKAEINDIYFTLESGVVTWTDRDGVPISTENENKPATVDYTADDNTFTVGNTRGASLPSTSGAGTTLYAVSGISLIALATFLLLRKKEKKIL